MLQRVRWWHLAAFAAAVVVGVYAWKFAPGSGGLSPAPEDWARFGEYVGGVFALLAFAGVLYTVELQRRQLELQRQQIRQLSDQATVDELHRICHELATRIDEALDYGIALSRTVADIMNPYPAAASMRGVLSVIGRLSEFKDVNPLIASEHPRIKAALEIQAVVVIRE